MTDSGLSPWPWTKKDGLLLALVLVLAALLAMRARLVIARYADYPPDFDEAVHALPALQVARDLQALRLADFLYHSFEQDALALYPFIHSWLLAPFFVIARPDISVARASGLVFVTGSAVLLYWLGRGLADEERWAELAGLVSAMLLLASVPVWVYASTVLIEPAGLMLTLVWLYAYGRADPGQPGAVWPIAASAAAAVVFFTKYSFGVFVMGTMIASECLALLAERRTQRWRLPGLFGPLALCVGVWFLMPGKFERFFAYSQAQQVQVDLWSMENLLYYPFVLFNHYSNGPLTALLSLSGLALAAARWSTHRWRVLGLYLLVGTIFLTLVPQKETRFGYTVLPAVFPMAGSALVMGAGWVSRARWPRLWRAGAWLLVGSAMVVEGLMAVRRHALFFDYALETAYHSSRDTAQAYQFIIGATLAQGERPHVINEWYLFNTQALAWEYYSTHAAEPAASSYLLATAGEAPEPTLENQHRFVEQMRTQATPMVVSIDGSPAGAYTGWQIVEPLITSGQLEAVASSPRYTLFEWPTEYRQRVLAGNFNSAAELEQARQAAQAQFTIQIHVYRTR